MLSHLRHRPTVAGQGVSFYHNENSGADRRQHGHSPAARFLRRKGLALPSSRKWVRGWDCLALGWHLLASTQPLFQAASAATQAGLRTPECPAGIIAIPRPLTRQRHRQPGIWGEALGQKGLAQDTQMSGAGEPRHPQGCCGGGTRPSR